jgi:hypothetical protein
MNTLSFVADAPQFDRGRMRRCHFGKPALSSRFSMEAVSGWKPGFEEVLHVVADRIEEA